MKNLFSTQWICILFVIATLLTSCYGVKQATWQLDKAHGKYPDLTAKKSMEWYPCIVTDSSTDIEFSLADDSTEFYKYQADSLMRIKAKVKDSLAIRYKDSCRSVQDNFEEGFNLGYKVGINDGKQVCPPDTVKLKTTIKIKDTRELQLKQSEVDELQRKNNIKSFWNKVFLIGGIIGWLVAVLLFLLIRKNRSDGYKQSYAPSQPPS